MSIPYFFLIDIYGPFFLISLSYFKVYLPCLFIIACSYRLSLHFIFSFLFLPFTLLCSRFIKNRKQIYNHAVLFTSPLIVSNIILVLFFIFLIFLSLSPPPFHLLLSVCLANPSPFSQYILWFLQVDTHVTNLTGRPFSSYVTLHGTHNITGNTTFLGVVKASVVESTSGYVDDLLVRNSTVLTTTGQQEYLGKDLI